MPEPLIAFYDSRDLPGGWHFNLAEDCPIVAHIPARLVAWDVVSEELAGMLHRLYGLEPPTHVGEPNPGLPLLDNSVSWVLEPYVRGLAEMGGQELRYAFEKADDGSCFVGLLPGDSGGPPPAYNGVIPGSSMIVNQDGLEQIKARLPQLGDDFDG